MPLSNLQQLNLGLAYAAATSELISEQEFSNLLRSWADRTDESIDQLLLETTNLSGELMVELKRRARELAEFVEADSVPAEEKTVSIQQPSGPAPMEETATRFLSDTSRVESEKSSFVVREHKSHEGLRSPSTQRFQKTRPLAKGGLGEVFVAQDCELNREVALKEIQRHCSTDPGLRARFLAEAEITGNLEHPGIVPVYGLGHHSDGRPFYAMRLIQGDSLREASQKFHSSDSKDFSSVQFRKLLGRFVDVCEAIEYAHSRGVLHRDLKPGNIMLGKYGETLVVDWGLAKAQGIDDDDGSNIALADRLQYDTAQTQIGAAMGTPAFMPPEQAEGKLEQLGTASDVYSLGATLYFMLVGQPPFAKCSNMKQLLGKVKKGEFESPVEIDNTVPKALSAICSQAMAWAPANRYDSPAALAGQVEHWLADEPVGAYHEPFKARFYRWVRKRKAMVSTFVAAIAVALFASIIATLLLTSKNKELADSNIRINKEVENTRLAQAETMEINKFLTEDLLNQADPELNAFAEKTTVVQLLNRASEKANDPSTFANQPKIKSSIHRTIGRSYFSLGSLGKAKHHLNQTIELLAQSGQGNTYASLETLFDLAEVNVIADDVVGLEATYEKVIHLVPDVAFANEKLAIESEVKTKLLESNIAWRRAKYVRANEVAESALKRACESLEQNNELVSDCRGLIADICAMRLVEFDTALKMRQEVVECLKKAGHADDAEEVLSAKINLVNMLGAYGKETEAKSIMEEIVDLRIHRLPANHPQLIYSKIGLSFILSSLFEFNASARLLEEAMTAAEESMGRDHYLSWLARESYAKLAVSTTQFVPVGFRKVGLAEQLGRENLELCEKRGWSTLHSDGFQSRWTLAGTLFNRRKVKESEQLIIEMLEEVSKVRKQSWECVALRNSLAGAMASTGRLKDAEQQAIQAWQLATEILPVNHAGRGNAASTLAKIRLMQNDYENAKPLLVEYLNYSNRSKGSPEQGFAGIKSVLAKCGLKSNLECELASIEMDKEKIYQVILKTPGQMATLMVKDENDNIVSVEDSGVRKDQCISYIIPRSSETHRVFAIPLVKSLGEAEYKLIVNEGAMSAEEPRQSELKDSSPIDFLQKDCKRESLQLNLEQGIAYQFVVSSDEFDPFVRLESDLGAIIKVDNNSGTGKSSEFRYVSQSAGDVSIVVLPNKLDGKGKFELAVSKFKLENQIENISSKFGREPKTNE